VSTSSLAQTQQLCEPELSTTPKRVKVAQKYPILVFGSDIFNENAPIFPKW